MGSLVIERLSPELSTDEHSAREDVHDFMVDTFIQHYPGFTEWYRRKVIPGFIQGERIIYVVRSAGAVCGVSILKFAAVGASSHKLCSFYLAPSARGSGIGPELMAQSLYQLEITLPGMPIKPIVATIAEERLAEKVGRRDLRIFFEEQGFALVKTIPNLYRRGKDEYILRRISHDLGQQAMLPTTSDASPALILGDRNK